jgi:arginine decarboxylase
MYQFSQHIERSNGGPEQVSDHPGETKQGFPVLVPGQVFSREILSFLCGLDTPEVHGYDPQVGYRVYTSKTIEMATPDHA